MSNIRTNNSRSIRTAGLGLFVALVLAASACGSGGSDEAAAGTPTAEPTPAATASPAPVSAPVTAEPTPVAEQKATSEPEPSPTAEQPTVTPTAQATPVPEPTVASTPEPVSQEPPAESQDEGFGDLLDVTVEDVPPAPEPVGDVIHIWPEDWDSVPVIEASFEEAVLQPPYVVVDGVRVGSRLSIPLDSFDIPPAEVVVVRAIELTDSGPSKVFFCGYDTWVGTLGEGRILFTTVLTEYNPFTREPLLPGQILFELPWRYRDPARTYPNEYGDNVDFGGVNIHHVPGIDPSCN